MEDKEKVLKKIADLNRINLAEKWEPVDGNHILTKVSFGRSLQEVSVYASSGIPIKAFYNTETGEIKLFPASMFEKDVKEV